MNIVPSKFAWASLLASSLALGALVGATGCGRSEAPSELELASNGGSPGIANRTGTPVTGGGETAANTVADEGDEDEESTDYWKDINFDRQNFEEVRQQVDKRYIDPSYDKVWSWAQAATFAIGSYEPRPIILLPEAFYQARKDNPDEKGALKGKMFKLSPTDKFVLLEESKEKVEEKRRRLSDDEIRKLRESSMERARALHKAWDDINFGEDEFNRLAAFIEREFKPTDKWTMKEAWIAAAQGYLYSLDPHSSLIAKASWDESNKKTQDSSFQGIGAVLTQRPDSEYTIVESPIYGQPAVKAGVRAGDMIIEVDGKDIKGESLSKVVSRIRGPSGSSVTLTIQREGEPDLKKIQITRTKIEQKNVQGQLVEAFPGVATIKVTGFVGTKINGIERTTDDDLVAEVERLGKLTPQGRLSGLILDLRNNSGGLLREGIKMADRFLRSGVIVSVRNRNSADDELYRAKDGDNWEFPVVVLVNDGTASAAEIVASALQDNQRALVVGDRTFGKASVQTLFFPLLQDDYYIKMTVARYYGPSGRTLQVTGVRPDIVAAPTADGKMPIGFREENLSGHLVPLDGDYPSPNADWAALAKSCVDKQGRAKKLLDKDPNPAIKFDWQLNLGADLLQCTIDLSLGDRAQR